jgi:retron-type reverse transcriptase
LEGSYRPQPVRKVVIPKPQEGTGNLGTLTVKDRIIEQAVHQVLSVDYERIFSTCSYGFRPNKNAHQALKQAGAFVAEGKIYVIDLDLEKFFDEVNHHRLMWLLSTRIADKRVLQLIHRYLKAGMLQGRLNRTTHQRYATRQPAKPSFFNTHNVR